MRWLTGPPGSGKTSTALKELRSALDRRDPGVRLLVPTATMAEHLRHTLAREGYLVRPTSIQTLSQFVEPLVAALPQASSAELYLAVESALDKLRPPEYTAVREYPGFAASVARAIDELSTAGCEARRLDRGALRMIFEAVEAEFAARGRGMRARRLLRAAEGLQRAGAGATHTVWIDGFFRFSPPERAVIDALDRHVNLTVTLPGEGQRLRPIPSQESFSAPTPDREADEIARRIAAEAHGGRLFREMGIVIRTPDVYAAPVEAALARCGIPARSYLSRPLAEHPAARALSRLIESMRAGWDIEHLLAALPWLAPDENLDRLDFLLRERLPARGRDALHGLAPESVSQRLAALESWRGATLAPSEWADRIGSLPVETLTPALYETVRCLAGSPPVSLVRFWKAMEAVLRLTPDFSRDNRRNAVHILSVYEARQWELPVVFVCGLNDGKFPRHPVCDPLLPESLRRTLGLPSQSDREQEERFLYDLSITRATERLVLSLACSDSRGRPELPSPFLDSEPALCSGFVRPRPRWEPPVHHAAAIRDPELVQIVAEKHRVMKPRGVESFLSCPYQFFAQFTLDLRTRPPRPEDRLDFRLQGTILHKVLAEAIRRPAELDAVHERVFEQECARQNVMAGYKKEFHRRQTLDDVRRFLDELKLPAAEEILTEWPFQIAMGDGIEVRGRVDRVDRLPGNRALVIDYKRGKFDITKPNLLQGPLYLLAVERGLGLAPAAMLYCSLRQRVALSGWVDPDARLGIAGEPLTREWLRQSEQALSAAAEEIRSGRIEPQPVSTEICRWCDFADVCRYRGRMTAAVGA